MTSGITYRNELLRKGIHLFSLLIPIVYSFVDKPLAIMILTPMVAVSVLLDILSHVNTRVRTFMLKLFGKLMRPHEVRADKILLNGASYVLIAALLSVIIFPKIVMMAAFSVLILADTAAALFGRRFGRTPFFDKSLEGAAAFFITAYGVIAAIGIIYSAPTVFFISGIGSALAGACVEAASIRLRFDDNLSIPLTVGAILLAGEWLAGYFFGQPGFLW